MTLTALSFEEREVVRRVLEANFHYFDFDFHTRLGITQQEMRDLLDMWPAIDDIRDNSIASVAINNSFNDLLHGFDLSESEALTFIGVNREELHRIYRKWAALRG